MLEMRLKEKHKLFGSTFSVYLDDFHTRVKLNWHHLLLKCFSLAIGSVGGKKEY